MNKKIITTMVFVLLTATVIPAVEALNNSFKGKNPVDMSLDGGWMKTFGGSDYDFGDCVQQTSDGGYIIGGETRSYGAGDLDVWIIKTDSRGNEEWNRTFGGSAYEFPNFIQQTNDGGYILIGGTTSFGVGDYDAWLIKTDSDGNKMWDKTYGGIDHDFGYTVYETVDGYIIGGVTKSFGEGDFDFWLIKTDADGKELWNKTFGGSGVDVCRQIRQTANDGYILVGVIYPTKIFDKAYCWLIKIDADGNKLWDKTIKGTWHSVPTGVRQTSDGGFIISGETNGFGFRIGQIPIYLGGGDMWLVKTDADGNKLWDKSFGGINFEDGGKCVSLTDEAGYIIVGFTKGFGGVIKQSPMFPPFSKAWAVKTDADGNVIWKKEFSRGICWWIEQTNDGGYIVTGCTKPHGKGDVFLIKIEQ